MEQDIRIISMQTFSNNDVQISSGNSFQSFVYVNKINVVKVDRKDDASLLKSSYQALQNVIKRREEEKQPYQTQQTMVVFREIDDNSFTPERIEAFWAAKKSLFFVTMVNIPICGCENKSACECLLDTEERIKKVFEGKDYLLYYTLEYNEIMLFCQGTDFEEYYKLVMRLNHEKLSDDKENYIIDTITLCGFGKGAETIDDSKVGAFIKIGFNDCDKTMRFLEENKLVSFDKRHLFGLLGRKDTAIVIEEITVAKLYKLLLAIKRQEFITTFNMTLLTKADIASGLQGSNFNIKSINDEVWIRTLTEYTNNLKISYIEFCQKNSMQTDNVFLRMVDSISSLIASSRQGRLAEDLAVCLWFPFKHFSEFMQKLAELDLSGKFEWELEFQQCLDVFCQNVILIENSTVHTNRQFVQIPHYESIAFEMPPKVMAYYTLITQKLLNSFNDQKPDAFCGAMLAPHLVNELEVEPLLCNDSIEPLQFIIVNISEAMLYDPRRAVAILGHELAHFSGNETRCRHERRKCIFAYYISYLLKEFVKKYMYQISASISEKEIDDGKIFELASKLSDKIISNGLKDGTSKDKPLKRELMREVSGLRNKLFSELAHDVIDGLIIRNGDILFSKYICKAYCTEMPNADEYISQLADDFANNAISMMDIINRFDETRREEMANYEKRVGYLFSETYSDLAMIKVFNISIRDYFNLYRKDLSTYPLVRNRSSSLREITLLRFVTVCAAAYGTDDRCDVVKDVETTNIDNALVEACQICNDINKMNCYAEEYDLDDSLMKMLYEYLKICANALNEALDGSEDVQCLKNEYRQLSENGHTITDFLKQILNMEKDYADNLA